MTQFSLRKLTIGDVEWIVQACQDPEILRWTTVPRPYTTEHAIQFANNAASEFAVWAIINSETPNGVISIHEVKQGVATVGYWVAPWGRRLGAASAGLRLVVTEARKFTEVVTLHAIIAPTNLASRKTAQSAGFTFYGISPAPCHDGQAQVAGEIYSFDMSDHQ